MRGVIGGDDVDGAVGEGGADRENIRLGAQRWVDLEAGVVAAHRLVGEKEVVRRDLGGDTDAAGLRPAQHLHRPCRRHVTDVQPGPGVLGEQHVPGDDRLLGDRGPAGEPELPADGPFVHLGTLGQPGFLRMLRDDSTERRRVLERSPHEEGVVNALPVVGEDPHGGATLRHSADLSKASSLEADRHRSDRSHRDVTGTLAERHHLFDHPCGVCHR